MGIGLDRLALLGSDVSSTIESVGAFTGNCFHKKMLIRNDSGLCKTDLCKLKEFTPANIQICTNHIFWAIRLCRKQMNSKPVEFCVYDD